MKVFWKVSSLFLLALALAWMPVFGVGAQSPTPTVTPTAAPASAALTFTPVLPNPAAVGDELSFDLVISVANQVPGISGAEFYVGYDPALVSTPSSPSATAEVLPDFFGSSNVSINEVLPAAQCPGGASPCVHLVLAGAPRTTQTGVAARFYFNAIADGNACFTMLQSSLVNADGASVPLTSAASVCTTVEASVTDTAGTILRQGVSSGGSHACTRVTLSDAVSSQQTYTDTLGAFSFADVAFGSYTLQASYPGFLAAQRTGIAISGSAAFTFSSYTMRGGDVNADNLINILDIGSIVSKFGQTGMSVLAADCTGADDPADINNDTLVNISDLAIVAGNWGLTGPATLP